MYQHINISYTLLKILYFVFRPGKLCVLCNLSEHSQLGQGKMMRAECSLEELPRDLPRESLMSPPETPPPIDSFSPRPPLQNRRQKGFAKFRSFKIFLFYFS